MRLSSTGPSSGASSLSPRSSSHGVPLSAPQNAAAAGGAAGGGGGAGGAAAGAAAVVVDVVVIIIAESQRAMERSD